MCLGCDVVFLVSEDHLEALLTRGRGRGVVEYVPCTCDVSYVDWGRTTRSLDSSRRKEGKKRNVVIPGFDVAIFRLDGVSSSFFSLYFLSLLGGGGCRIFTSSGNSFYGIYRQVPFGGGTLEPGRQAGKMRK